MNLRQLRYFVTLAEHKNFSVAASHLFISQPTLSQEIAKLENEFGFPLFVRLPRSIQLTDEAVTLLPHAKAILANVTEFMHYAEALKNQKQGIMSLVVGLDTGWNQFECRGITDLFYRFREANPDISMSMMPFHYPDCLSQLESGTMDLAVIFGSKNLFDNLNCNYQILADEEICLAVPAASCGAETDVSSVLSHNKLLIISDDTDHMIHANIVMKRYNCQPQVVGLRDSGSILAYVSAGAGVGLVSKSYCARSTLKNIRILEMTPDPPMGYLAVIWSKKCQNSCALEMVKWLRSTAGSLERAGAVPV